MSVVIGVIAIALLPCKSVTYYGSESTQVDTYRDEVKSYIYDESKKIGINPDLSLCIVEHESQFRGDIIGDKDFIGASWGWWQINSYYNKDISQEFAFNLVSSTQWSLKQIKKGNAKLWSTYKLYCKHIPVFLPQNVL